MALEQQLGPAPSPTNNALGSWPDVRDYTATYQTAYANLGNGQPAKLFSSYDQQTVNTHFQWMQQNGCDTAALQRFNPTGGEGPTRDAMAVKVRQAAEQYGRKFYIMYDATAWQNMQSEMKTDWINKMQSYTSSLLRTRSRTANRSSASGASGSTRPTRTGKPRSVWTSSTGSRARAAT